MDQPPIFVVTGQLAAGKSTLSRAVLARFPFGYHIDTDAIREMVVSGLASPLQWTDETTRQFDLALEGSVALAAVYHRAGFAVAIEGGIDPAAIDRLVRAVGLGDHLVGVILRPPLDVALRRNRERRTKSFDTSALEGVMAAIDDDLARAAVPPGWVTIDNGHEPVEATVERLLAQV